VRSTRWAIWLFVPDPFSKPNSAKHPLGHLAIRSWPLFQAIDQNLSNRIRIRSTN